ncbi:MAG TPA: NAD(P)H-dependent glycerol-3-phosphate dehydrogenase [Devosiaceae bacterium]|jgi:glycerol-3-phosphate dehydrogenase (NAD(P)+)
MALERAAVIGAGAWGTALAQAAAMAGRQVTLLARDPKLIAEINALHTSARYLGTQVLSSAIVASDDLSALGAVDFVILAVPAQATRAALAGIDRRQLAGKPVVLSAKGLEANTLKRQSEILREVAPEAVAFVLSGPSFAVDVAAGRPTAVTLAGDDPEQTSRLAAALAGPSFRPYAADDMIGVELAGGLKNVYALGCGAVEGAALGASARAALLARAYAEMARIVSALGGSATTLTGLAGFGDLTLSCTSTQSRNYQFGLRLGQGESAAAILSSGAKLAEGVATAPVALHLAEKLGIDAPLIGAVNQLLAGNASIANIVGGLMARPLKREN